VLAGSCEMATTANFIQHSHALERFYEGVAPILI